MLLSEVVEELVADSCSPPWTGELVFWYLALSGDALSFSHRWIAPFYSVSPPSPLRTISVAS